MIRMMDPMGRAIADYPLSEVYEGLSDKGFVSLNCIPSSW